MTESTFTFRLPKDLKDSFDAIAKGQDQSAAQLLRAFMRDYVRAHSQVEMDFRSKRKK